MRIGWLWALVVSAWAGIAGAQQTGTPTFEVPAPVVSPTILTVDIDRLFAQSMFGERIGREYTQGRADLANENRRIADALREEELALAERRPEMDVSIFRTEAAAFDEKAQAIRRAQDAKERDLEETLARGREQFLEVTQPILGQLMLEREAYAILDRRSILLSLGSIDITDEAIARVDGTIGDGAGDLAIEDPAQVTAPDTEQEGVSD